VIKASPLGQCSMLTPSNPVVDLVRATGARGGSRESTIAMKRNMVPLLGIAFVVAIISTGIFYGLFAGKLRSSSDIPGHSVVVAARDLDRGTVVQSSDLQISGAAGILTGSFSKPEEAVGAVLLTPLKAGEPLLAERVASRVSGGGSSNGMVPSGMRAISIRVTGSDGLLGLLRPGARVDLQAVSDRDNRVELRNVLQNVEVLAVSLPDANSSRGAGAIVTVLTHAQDADVVALSDAGAKIRVALRNPLDEATTTHRAMALASVFSNQATLAEQALQVTSSARRTDAWDHPIQLHVQVLDVNDAAFAELGSRLDPAPGSENSDAAWRLGSFRSGEDAAKLIHSLREKQELDVVSSGRLMAGVGRPISYRAGTAQSQLRVQFAPEVGPGGAVSLRVKPEISVTSGSGVATSKYDAGVLPDSSFLLEGAWTDHSSERLFPEHSWKQRHLVIFVTAYSIQRSSAVAVARSGREH
jgi:pilus assembly protein CpaB